VPIEYIQSRYGKKTVAKNRDKMDIWQTTHGNHGIVHPHYGSLSATSAPAAFEGMSANSRDMTKGMKNEYQEMVELREVWLDGPNGTCKRYIVQMGEWIAEDKDFMNEVYYCPLICDRLIDTGSPYGYGLCDMLMPLNREAESMLSKLFENVRDLDRFGILMLPQGTFDHKTKFHETQHGLTVGYWEPEAWYGQIRPFEVRPNNSGDAPGRTAAMAEQISDSYAPIPAVTQGEAPGRVDSASALQFLGEQANNLNRGGIKALNNIFGKGYQACLQQAILKLGRDKPIPIRVIDQSLLGLVVDPQTGGMSLSKNPVPSSASLQFGIRETEPRNILGRKSELLELHQRQIITTQQLLLTNVKERLDLPIYAPEIEAALRKAEMDAVILFGDGETPGEITGNPIQDVAWVHLTVITSIMATPEFAASGPDIQKIFGERKRDLLDDLGMTLPGGGPPPDDAAMLLEAEQIVGSLQQMAGTLGNNQGGGVAPPAA
jgi:hypothetical protein